MTAVVVIVIAFLTSLTLTALLIRWAPRLGLVDQPSERKVHTRTTPRGGGLAIYAGMLAAVGTAWLLSTQHSALSTQYSVLSTQLLFLGLAAVIVVLGLLDDLFNLSWKVRLGMQTLAAVGAIAWLVPYPARFGICATFWIVALVNAFNMLDNMDALSAGSAWIAAGMFALSLGDETALPYLLLMGALTGFLCFNRPPACIFMGDAGSTFLGFFLGVRSLTDEFIKPGVPHTWFVPMCILAVPLYDQLTVVTLRLWQGRSPFHADKQHLSHRLVALGLSQVAAVGVICLFGLASGAAGIALTSVSEATAWLIVGTLACGWLVVACVEYLPHFRKKV